MDRTVPDPAARPPTEDDPRALERLLAEHQHQLRSYMRLRIGPELRRREDSTDLAQSVCREMLEDAPRFAAATPDRETFRRWLYTAARRKLADRVAFHRAARRDLRREAGRRGDGSDDRSPNGLVDRNAFTDFTPSRHARAREQLETIEWALDRLHPAYRELILLARVFGMSRAEIAEQTGRTVAAVRTGLSRAQARLAALIEDAEPIGDDDSRTP